MEIIVVVVDIHQLTLDYYILYAPPQSRSPRIRDKQKRARERERDAILIIPLASKAGPVRINHLLLA